MNISLLYRDQTGGSLREEPSSPTRLLSLTLGVTALAMLGLVRNAYTSIKQIEPTE